MNRTKFTHKKTEVLKFYYFLTCFFLPASLIRYFFEVVESIWDPWSEFPIYTVTYILAFIAMLVSFLGLIKFRRWGLLGLSLVLIFVSALQFLYAIYDIKTNVELETLVMDVLSALVSVVYTILIYVYFKHRATMFTNKNESVTEETALPIDETPRKNRVWLYLVLFSIGSIFLYSLCNSMASSITSAAYYSLPFMSKLLDYPYPGTIPYEYQYTALYLLFEALLAFMAAYAVKKAEILSFEEMAFKPNKKSILSLLIGGLSGIVLVILVAGVLIATGSSFRSNNLFPRVIFTIICGIPLYLGVGMAEETIFRGILQKYFEKKNMKVLGVFISALMFMLMHWITGAYNELSAFVFLFAFGLMESMILIYFDNLWLCMGIHFGYDWAVTHFLEMRYLINKNSFFSLQKLTKWRVSLSITFVALAVAVVFFILTLIRNKKKDS